MNAINYADHRNNRECVATRISLIMERMIPLDANANIRRCRVMRVWEHASPVPRVWLVMDRNNGTRLDLAYVEVNADGPQIFASANGPDRALLTAAVEEAEADIAREIAEQDARIAARPHRCNRCLRTDVGATLREPPVSLFDAGEYLCDACVAAIADLWRSGDEATREILETPHDEWMAQMREAHNAIADQDRAENQS